MSEKPKLAYALTSNPFPLQASPTAGNLNRVTLTLVVSNPQDDAITVYGLSITLPIGESGTELTNTTPAAVAAKGWLLHDTQEETGSVEYIFWPPGSSSKKPKAYELKTEGFSFRFENVAVNRQPGTAQIKITEGSSRKKKGSPTIDLPLSKFPPVWGTISFWADTPSIDFNSEAKLEWAGPAEQGQGPQATYTLQYDTPDAGLVTIPKSGEAALGSQGSYPGQDQSLRLQQTTTFTLTVSAQIDTTHYQAQKQVTIQVSAPTPTVSITSEPLSGTPIGANTPLKIIWTVIGADKLVLTGSDGSTKTFEDKSDFPQGSTTIYPQKPTNYAITAYKEGKQAATSSEIAANVQPVKIYYLSASPNPTGPDNKSTVRWLVENETAVSLTTNISGIGPFNKLPQMGEQVFSLTQPTAVTLTAQGYQPQSQTITLEPYHYLTDLSGLYEGGGGVVVVSPDSQTVHIVSFRSAKVYAYNIAKDEYSDPIPVGELPLAAAIAPDGKRLYVAGTDDNTISIIDTVKNRRTDMIEIGRRPIGIAVSPDSKTIYVLNSDDNAVAVLAADTLSITKTISVGNKPEAMALSPNGRSLFVANFRDNKVTAIVDIDKPDEVRSLPSGGAMPVNLAVSPDGKMLLVANRFRAGQDKEGLIRQFDLENDFQSSDIVTPLPLGKMVFTLDNQTFFVSSDPKDSTDGPSQLWLCKPNRAESKGTVQPIPDAYGGGLSFAPDGKHLYIGDEGALTKLSLPKPPPSVAAAVYAQSSQYHGWAGYYLFSGTNYTQYRWENGRFATWPSYPQPNSTWNGAFTSMDAAFYAAESVYLFSGTQFVRYGDPGGTQAIEQPQQVDETTWPGLPFQSLTAAFAISLNQIYLFSDEAYCIYDLENKRMVQAAEAVTVKSWPDLPFQRIDAAFINDQKEVTFFSGVQYCVYNLVQKRMVSDWPLPINDYSWPSLPYPSVPKISELVYGVDPNVGAPMLSWSVTLATDISFSAPMVQRMIAYQNQGQIPPEGRSPIQLVPGSKITLIAENAFGSTEKTITIS